MLTAILLPDEHDADEVRRIILERYDMSLGAGLGKVAGKVFRIGHLGHFNDLTLAGTLSGVQMGLRLAGVPIEDGGLEAALDPAGAAVTAVDAGSASGVAAGRSCAGGSSATSRARSRSTTTAATCSPATPACTRCCRSASSTRAAPTTSRRPSPRPPSSACRSRPAAPAPASPARRSAAGLVLDTSRHLDRIHELDPSSRTAVVDVGVVQDQLNRAAAPHGLLFGPDTSTSNRATIGGMTGNNSAGSGSLRYGMTIDHVRALEVVLSDGSTARLEPVDEAERARRARAETLEGRIYRGLPDIMERHARAIAEDFPPFWRRACGYRLDRLADPRHGLFDLAKFVVGSEGTLAVTTRAEVDLVPKPRHTVFAVGHFDSIPAAIDATTDALSLRPGAGRADGQDDPRPLAQQDRVRRPRQEPGGRPGRPAVRLLHRRRPRRDHRTGSTS